MRIVGHEAHADHSVVVLEGKLDIAGTQQVELAFSGRTSARKVHALVDISRVDFIASYGMRMLVSAAQALRGYGARVVLVGPPDQVAHAIRTARLDTVMPIVEHRDAAYALLGIVHSGDGRAADASGTPSA